MPATLIPGLRSPHDTVGGIVHFGRMIDKIRLEAAANLPEAWVKFMDVKWSFNWLCCHFLRVDYAELKTEVLKGGSDEEILEWAMARGCRPDEADIEVWNGFMTKLGWRDFVSDRVRFRLEESGFPPDAAETMFDFIDLDEGRPLRER
jgi:gluconokinase